jgi:hypothetical protein
VKIKHSAFNIASIVLFAAGVLLFMTVEAGELYWLPVTAFVAGALLFIIPTLFFYGEINRRKYIIAYRIFLIIFVVGIPTIALSIACIAFFVAITSFMITDLIKSQTKRVVFCVSSLSVFTAAMVASVFDYLAKSETEEVLGAFFSLVLAGMVFLGLAVMSAIRLFLWLDMKVYRKKALAGETGVNVPDGNPEPETDREYNDARRILALMKQNKHE